MLLSFAGLFFLSLGKAMIHDDQQGGASWMQVYGVAVLCGVGFTMSLFIGALAFPGAVDSPQQIEVKLGVIGGSLMSVLWGALVLALAGRKSGKEIAETEPV